jgi:hypothetical protein
MGENGPVPLPRPLCARKLAKTTARYPMRLLAAGLLAAAVALSGCLPSQRRQHDRDLFPADSLSRLVAQTVPEETLELVWRAEAPRQANVRYPLTIAWVGERIVMADVRRGALHIFDEDGHFLGSFADDAIEYPFLAGGRRDTVAVLSRGTNQLHLVALDGEGRGRLARSLPVPDGRNAVALLGEHGLYAKIADEDAGAEIYRLDETSGAVLERHPLPEAHWRHIGFLRTWGDALVSLSGYRPVVDLLQPGGAASAVIDTLALVGFDSPQLHRSRLFALGRVNEPPLLSPSADAAGPLLFVLNARPGWIHIDVFERDGDALRLRRSLLSPDAEPRPNFFVADVAVRQRGAGYDILILENHPRPAVLRYRWEER